MKVDFIHDVSKDQVEYFTEITKHDRCRVTEWLKGQTGKTAREERFLKHVSEAVRKINYDYMIATIEPSVEKGRIYYAENNEVGVNFSSNNWQKMARKYKPEMGSRLCNLHELLIWYVLRIVNKSWTLDYVANDSSNAGNYYNSANSANNIEKTGVRECGGYRDGQGNTYKIVTSGYGYGYALVGGYYGDDGYHHPVADIEFVLNRPFDIHHTGSGVIVLTNYKKVST